MVRPSSRWNATATGWTVMVFRFLQAPLSADLSYATGEKAELIGKPSPDFFQAAIMDIGAEPGNLLMVGDDIRSDIGGAKRIGMRAALVKTGKFRDEQLKDADIMPDYLINSVADIPRLLDL